MCVKYNLEKYTDKLQIADVEFDRVIMVML